MQRPDRRSLLREQPRHLRTFECSFCGKNQHQVKSLIAGAGVSLHLQRMRAGLRRASPTQGEAEQRQAPDVIGFGEPEPQS